MLGHYSLTYIRLGRTRNNNSLIFVDSGIFFVIFVSEADRLVKSIINLQNNTINPTNILTSNKVSGLGYDFISLSIAVFTCRPFFPSIKNNNLVLIINSHCLGDTSMIFSL